MRHGCCIFASVFEWFVSAGLLKKSIDYYFLYKNNKLSILGVIYRSGNYSLSLILQICVKYCVASGGGLQSRESFLGENGLR